MPDPLILIPARMQATRLPGKPLADILGEPMIVHVWRRAMESGVGVAVVATDEPRIVEAIEKVGGRAVLTRSDHHTGSDRIKEAADIVDPDGRHDIIVNVQGDLPTIDPRVIAASVEPLSDSAVDIVTLASVITREDEKSEPSVVKAIGSEISPGRMRALYFTRVTAPGGEGPLYHHIGLYTYRRKALDRFVSLPPSPLEKRERLEQLRAVEDGMRIDIIVVDDVPLGVDTPHDLDRARAILAARAGA
ncbi:3-deoxy-manno-octulosonate cytidylyltransferase [Bosea sp. (in: a-proteobacteria)]|jgi:3-deoxy-manno-octulosonate cytidylyltransferase (CMP-KDO synthetase)|uniref:3-deoxy-manno-octulosonate cytidylyltransferase n=1 Tax=Bosea sp. (in: a-proteobacteria) TaxID=1871050 RepID=UPI003F6E847A